MSSEKTTGPQARPIYALQQLLVSDGWDRESLQAKRSLEVKEKSDFSKRFGVKSHEGGNFLEISFP